jgi:hypothetical protein
MGLQQAGGLRRLQGHAAGARILACSPDLVVASIGDEDIPGSIHGHARGLVQRGVDGGAVIAAVAAGGDACHCGDGAVGAVDEPAGRRRGGPSGCWLGTQRSTLH